MFFKINYHIFQSLHDFRSFSFHIFYVRNYFHDFHQKFIVIQVLFSRRVLWNTNISLNNKFLKVFQGSFELVQQKFSVNLVPLFHFLFQIPSHRFQVNFQPSDGHRGGNLLNISLDVFQLGDLLIEFNHRGEFRSASLQ